MVGRPLAPTSGAVDDRRRADGRRPRWPEAAHRPRAAGPRHLPRPHRAREPHALRPRSTGCAGPELRDRVDEVLELVGLTERAQRPDQGVLRRDEAPAQHRHRPAPPAELLILDEPTVGVDPQSRNQILETRGAAAPSRAWPSSTRPTTWRRPSALCDRVGIIDSGKLQAEGSQDELIRLTEGADHIRLAGSGDTNAAADTLRALPAVQQVVADRHSLQLTVTDAPTAVAEIVTSATAAGMTLADVEITRPDLESVFLHLTGKALRD